MNSSSGVGSGANQQQPRKVSNQNIQVYVRVRPLNTRERTIRSAEVIDVISAREVVTRHSLESKLTKKFTFDRVFGTDSRQADVYSTVVAPLIEEVLSGYNCTVFAYGQTGTGKTHTMVGTECAELKSSWEDDSDIGIIPRALSHLFDELRMMEMEFSMRISYLELYNEELCDLLSSDDSTKIRIFDDSTKKGSVIIQGLEEIPVHSKDDVYKLLEKGKERRKTATTLMNAQSSRSHTVFSILVHIRENGIDGEEMLKIGKLNLVDLAGSENVTKAGNEKGIRARETVNINQSLLTLGRVITALVERTPHIPYRESKLTRLLQESLGGRTKTSIIATISPGHKDIEETLSTLEYAHRAKNIQNKPEVNQKLTKKTVLKEYTEEIDKLKRDLMAARDKNGIYLAEETYNEMTLKMDSQNRELNEKMLLLKALKDELQNKEKIFNEVSLNLVEKTEELKRTEKNLTQTQGALQETKKILNNTKRRYKEKKVLLQSHVSTEKVLINQATQILEVADLATNDTQKLHSTIERRKDVDQKIQTACERFAERMHDNFELMDESLINLEKQHKSCSQMLLQEFTNSTIVHKKLLGNCNEKIEKVNELCEQSMMSTSAIGEKYAKLLSELSAEHKSSIEQLFNELESKEREFVSQIRESIAELGECNEQQRITFEEMRGSVVETLSSNSNDLRTYITELQECLADVKSISEENMQELSRIQEEVANERCFAEQEQIAMEEIIEKMRELKEKSFAARNKSADTLNELTARLENNNQKSIAQLLKGSKNAQSFCQERCADNASSQECYEQKTADALECVEKHIAKRSIIDTKLSNWRENSTKQMEALTDAENAHCTRMQTAIEEHVMELKRMRLEKEKETGDACEAVKGGLAADTQQLKQHLAVADGLTKTLQQHVFDYSKAYKSQMGSCATNVENFRQSELKTYAPTGTTPSKRNFVYPRSLAATSPHNEIIKRFRQENDWSDLDTTAATIDEGSEDEEPVQASVVQDISSNEMMLNSTPIDLTNSIVQPSSINSRSLNVLRSTQHLYTTGSLSCNNSPRKSSQQNLQSYTKENKENVS